MGYHRRLVSLSLLLISSVLLPIDAKHNTPPRFVSEKGSDGSEIVVRVKEGESSLGKQIYHLIGEDSDGDPLKFGVLGAIGEDMLRIEQLPPNEAKVYLKKELDREIQDSYTLALTLTDGKLGKGNYITKTLLIIVEDINDNTPIFRPYRTSITLSESLRPGIIETLEAFDSDEGRFGQVLYQLMDIDHEETSQPSNTFSIETVEGKGVISLISGLDYERKSIYQLRVLAIDRAMEAQRRTATAAIVVQVEDAEDQPPVFIFVPSITRIAEDLPIGAPVLRVIAVDGDRGVNNAITYRISKGGRGLFNINSNTGFVTVSGKLDRESAINSNHSSNSAPGAFILEIEASEVTVAVFPPPTITTEVTIILTDVNDETPVIAPFAGECAVINEFHPIGDFVTIVTATDNDDYNTPNGRVSFSIAGGNEHHLFDFEQLPLNSAKLVTRLSVRGRVGNYSLIIRATDGGSPQRWSSATLNICITDVNDHNPIFVKPPSNITVRMPENATIGSQVVEVFANDEDSGLNAIVKYKLRRLQNGHWKWFDINENTGVIRVAKQLDRETQRIHELRVQAYDLGEPTSLSTDLDLTIIVTDVNDEIPVIAPMAAECAVINEFHPIRDIVTIVAATDNDDYNTPNGRVSFMIIDGNKDRLFSFEQLPLNSAKLVTRFSVRGRVGNYSLLIRATDGGSPQRWSSSTLNICITDVNDHNPIFVKPHSNMTVQVPENATIGSHVVDVLANDEDSGANAIVKYKLRQLPNGHWKWFDINENTGVITVAKQLDRETQRIHELRVQAYDLGEPTSLSTDLDLTVFVTDVDDYEPEFTQDVFQIVFSENTLPELEKYVLLPTIDKDDYDLIDPAVGFKSIPCYFIVGGDGGERFRLDTFTHELTTTVTLDREEKDSYTLIVQATNECFKVPPMISEFDHKNNSLLQVLITVRDVNDNSPKMTKEVFTGGFTTDVDFGTVIMEVKAFDNDLGANSVVNYYIISEVKQSLTEGLDTLSNEPFIINRNTGEICLNFDPQKDMKGYFEFNVLANDTDGLADSAKVVIYLLRDDQRVRFVLRLTPQELREKLDKFRDVLANITGATVNIDSYKFHENRDGSVDKKKTDMYLHFVNRDDNSIIDVNNVLSLIDKNIDYLDELYKEFNVLLSEATQNSEFFIEWEDQLKACLLGSTSFLLLLLILVTCLCLNQKSRYERQLKAATAPVFGPESQLTRSNVPNTNQHATEGSNPMWMTGYDNHWYKEDEQLSDQSTAGNSLDENAIVEITDSPNDSLNGSAGRDSGGSGASTTNDRSALCRTGISVGRVTPQNITLPINNNNSNNTSVNSSHTNHIKPIISSNTNNVNVNNNVNNNNKKLAPKPPVKPEKQQTLNCNSKLLLTGDKQQLGNQRLTSIPKTNVVSNVYIESYHSNHNHNNNNNNPKHNFVHHNSHTSSNHLPSQHHNQQQQQQQHPQNIHTFSNHLSLMNLETTEL